jgi:tetratricopeptide (TPR) repeat protein
MQEASMRAEALSRLVFTILATAMLSLAGTGPAQAFETLISGSSDARVCLTAARLAADRHLVDRPAMVHCDRAIENDNLSTHDLAATYVNRGIIRLCAADFAAAEKDFDRAIRIMPELAGAHMNRGAVLVALNRPQEAIEALDRSLTLGTPEPERAYFDRALAHEKLNDIKGAYYDLKQAAALNPTWDAPVKELAYFQVTRQ